MKSALLKVGIVSAGIAASAMFVDLQPASATSFSGDYDLSYWSVYNIDIANNTNPPTITNPATYTNGFLETSGAPNSVTLVGGNICGNCTVPAPDTDGDGNPGVTGATYFETLLASDGYVSFNWNYGTFDVRGFDPFIVQINGGLETTLANIDGQYGFYVSPFLTAGTLFSFGIFTYDNAGGAGYATLSNFAVTSSPPAAVPTPALLPGLIGMGVAALRKKQQDSQELSA